MKFAKKFPSFSGIQSALPHMNNTAIRVISIICLTILSGLNAPSVQPVNEDTSRYFSMKEFSAINASAKIFFKIRGEAQYEHSPSFHSKCRNMCITLTFSNHRNNQNTVSAISSGKHSSAVYCRHKFFKIIVLQKSHLMSELCTAE